MTRGATREFFEPTDPRWNALATPKIVYRQCMRSSERHILRLRQLTSSFATANLRSEKPIHQVRITDHLSLGTQGRGTGVGRGLGFGRSLSLVDRVVRNTPPPAVPAWHSLRNPRPMPKHFHRRASGRC